MEKAKERSELESLVNRASRVRLNRSQAPLNELCAVGVAFARAQLDRRVREPRQSIDRVLCGFERYLKQRLREITKPCLDLQLYAAGRAAEIVAWYGIGASEKFETAADLMLRLFSVFPALARLWLVVISDWQAMVSELLQRLQKDRRAIAGAFFGGAQLGPVLELRAGLSDPHRGGRAVVEINFAVGRVIYKPRSGKGERAWFNLLRWMNSHGYEPRFRDVRTLLRRNYCWMEAVQAAPCGSLQGVKRFYARFGGMLFLAHHLGLVDCHRGNLIAVGEHPVLVDAETLFHPMRNPKTRRSRTLFETGLLPLPADATEAEFESSPLCGAGGAHLVTLDGVPCAPRSFEKQIVRGFQVARKVLTGSTHRRRAFARRRKRLKKMPWRRIIQPTRIYWRICQHSIEPHALRSQRARTRTLARLGRLAGLRRTTLPREITAMARLDVPYFIRAGIVLRENIQRNITPTDLGH